MKSAVKAVKILQAISNTGLRGRLVEKFLSGILKIAKPRAGIIDKNLQIVYPESSAEWRRLMRSSVYENLAWTLTEILALQRNPAQVFEWIKKIENEDIINNLFEKKRGAIFLTGHFGNWELLGSWYAQNAKRHGHELYIVFQAIHDPDIWQYVREIREQNGMILLPKEMSAMELARLLRKGAHIAILNDISWNRKLMLPFMGKVCTTSPGPAVLAMLGGVPIIPACINRNGPFSHDVKFYAPINVPGKELKQEERIRAAALECNKALEKIILDRPELWFWLHNRWK